MVNDHLFKRVGFISQAQLLKTNIINIRFESDFFKFADSLSSVKTMGGCCSLLVPEAIFGAAPFLRQFLRSEPPVTTVFHLLPELTRWSPIGL